MLSTLLVLPEPASARGIAGRTDLPIPVWLFGAAATVVLIVSFALLRLFWSTSGVPAPPRTRPLWPPVSLLAGGLGVAFFGLVVLAGAQGTVTTTANFAPTFVFVVFWVGLPLLSVMFGDLFALLSPWGAIARAATDIAGRAGYVPRPPRVYPAGFGRWPAALGLLVFTWLDVAYAHGSDPRLIAVLAALYAAGQLVGMSVYGREAWTRNADAFAVLFSLFAQLSVVELTNERAGLRRPLAGLGTQRPVRGTAAVLCVLIGAVTFDGLTATTLWQRLQPNLAGFAFDWGASLATGRDFAATAGLLTCIALIAGAYLAAIGLMRALTSKAPSRLAVQFAASLSPIAVAYLLAHYGSLLLFQGQTAVALLSDPLGRGDNLLGTADVDVDYGLLSAAGLWYVQVSILVLGHVAGLLAAHERALRVFEQPGTVTRSQLSMLAVMVIYTLLALWLLASINL